MLPLVLTVIIDPKRLIGETRDDTGAWKILSFAIVIRLDFRLCSGFKTFFSVILYVAYKISKRDQGIWLHYILKKRAFLVYII